HARNAQARGDPDQIAHTHRLHPFAVEANFGQLGIENFVNLAAIGFGVGRDLFASERLAGFGTSGRIADHRGEVADQEDHGVAVALKVAQLLEHNRVPQMQIRRGRIHAELDSERTAEFQLRFEFRLRNDLNRAARERGHPLFDTRFLLWNAALTRYLEEP